MSYLSAHAMLSRRHYVVKATADNCWFNFYCNKVREYRQRYGDDFCLVVNNSTTTDRAYVLPFGAVKEYFTEKNREADGRRWVGTIVGNHLKLGPAECSMPVGRYFNRFDVLEPETARC
jgi:hypothetical protein